jgi:predicted nucleotidyltransferase component of viral defense system
VKEHLVSLIRPEFSPSHAKNVAREYLQALILQGLQRAGAMTALAFHGGTALRFLYSLPRYSEDLDFALEGVAAAYDFRAYIQTVQRDLAAQGYQITVKIGDKKAVHGALIRFTGLLYDLNLSPHRDEVFAVKVEVDTRPPQGAGKTSSLVRRHILLNLYHHDQASLLAGKLHAILQRNYVKGRDFYDLLWYLSDRNWASPNLTLLNNALAQTNWSGKAVTSENWKELVRAQIKSVSWEQVTSDVLPFLEDSQDVHLLTKQNLLKLLD